MFMSLVLGALLAAQLPVDDFTRKAAFGSAKLSPDGTHLAMTVDTDDGNVLTMLELPTLKLVGSLKFNGSNVGQFWWVNNERLVTQVLEWQEGSELPAYYGELYGVNRDGSKGEIIFGYRAGQTSKLMTVKTKRNVYAVANFIDMLPDDSKHILISTSSAGTMTNPKPGQILRLNVYNGKVKRVMSLPHLSMDVLTDRSGNPRFSIGQNSEGDLTVFSRKVDGADWTLVKTDPDEEISPVAFEGDNAVLFTVDNEKTGLKSLVELDLNSGKRTTRWKDDYVSPIGGFSTADGRGSIALKTMPDSVQYHFIQDEGLEVKFLKKLLATYPGRNINVMNYTRDAKQAVVVITSDREPPSLYIMNTDDGSVRHRIDAYPWLKPNDLAAMRPFWFQASDGVEIQAYLTLPNGEKKQGLPMIVLPHGGPHGPRDMWGYNPEVQFFANRGIAVLQVNFRGSGGFGKKFEKSGYRKWGGRIQEDIIDATKFIMSQGIAAKDRTCIYGASFGGYSALQAPVVAPGLFQCAVGLVGVYDLDLLYNDGDVRMRKSGRNYLEEVIGRDEAELRKFSPVFHAEKLTLPVFLIHGKLDFRAPIEHAYRMRDALKKVGRDPQWLVMDKEGHGFYKSENRSIMYNQILDFMKPHLKL